MAKTLQEIRQFTEGMGIPGRDLWDLPSSTKTFPDSTHWRIEISGVEYPSTMEAMIDEAKKRNVVIHRAVVTVGGSTLRDLAELRAIAQMGRDEKIEVITTMGPRKGWDVGARAPGFTEGAMVGFRLRGCDNISYWLADMMRNIDAGLRGFLVMDEGILSIVTRMREEGFIPTKTFFKWSAFGGYCSAAGARVIELMGANSMNPPSDVSLPILASIRRTVNIPIDIYMFITDAEGGMFRIYDAPEIARVTSPCYFKIEPGVSQNDIYKPWITESWHAEFMREKVKEAAIFQEIMERHAPQLKLSGVGPSDLVLPEPE
ncbi:MAG: hypothetical protein ACOC6R_01860 [Chloroflexota bacterium]